MDLIHVHSYAVSIYARVIKFFLKIPYVITEHSSIFARTELSKKSRALIRFGYRGAAEVIAVSDGLAKRIQPFCKTAVKVIPNMVSDSFFEDDPSTPDAFSATGASSGVGRAFSFLSVAFLHRNKGLDILLAAFAELSASDYDIQLAIGGDGEEYESLLALSQSLGVAQCVHFYGALSREAVKQRLRECDCFVLPSRTESFGIVYVEALALGKPIIMAATDAAATIVNVENGLIVPVEDSHALCRAMEAMLLDYGRYDKEIIVTDCKDRFSEAAVCDQIIRLYQQVSA
jgi:glycosyltransferase involved in cell wall biosynthesis